MKAIGIRMTANRPGSQLDFHSPLKGQEKDSATNFMWGLLRTLTSEHAFGKMVGMDSQVDELALLEAAVERFYQHPVPTAGPALAGYLTRVQGMSDRLAVKSAQAASAFAETEEYDDQGFVSPIHWIRVNCHLTGGAAADRVAVGQQLEKIPESHQSLLEGEIGFAHLAHTARTAAAIEESGTNQAFDEMALLEQARELPVGRFIEFCHQMRHSADPQGYVAQEVAGVEARSLTMKTGEGGLVWLRGVDRKSVV